jgi:UDP-glucose 4-epimerase
LTRGATATSPAVTRTRTAAPFADYDADAFEPVNQSGTTGLATAVEEVGRARLADLSSVSVCGTAGEDADESTPPQAQRFYGVSKLRGEEHGRRLQGARRARRTRPRPCATSA